MIEHNKRGLALIETHPFSQVKVIHPLKVLDMTGIKLGLDGAHQKMNASLAVALCKTFVARLKNSLIATTAKDSWLEDLLLDSGELPDAYLRGLQACEWPGRCQKIFLQNYGIVLFLDGAHTGESMAVCRDWYLAQQQSSNDGGILRVLIFNCMDTRDPVTLLKPLTENCGFDMVIFSSNSTGKQHTLEDKRHHSQDAKTIWQHNILNSWRTLKGTSTSAESTRTSSDGKVSFGGAADGEVYATIPNVLDRLISVEASLDRKKTLHVLITGSLYLVGGWLEVLSSNPWLVREDQRALIAEMAEDVT